MRNVLVALCALIVPLAARAQTPVPAPNPALQASVTLAELSGVARSPGWDVSAVNDLLAAETTTAKRKSTGKLLMIIGGSAVVAGAIIGEGGGAALIVAGILTGGYGFWLFQGK